MYLFKKNRATSRTKTIPEKIKRLSILYWM